MTMTTSTSLVTITCMPISHDPLTPPDARRRVVQSCPGLGPGDRAWKKRAAAHIANVCSPGRARGKIVRRAFARRAERPKSVVDRVRSFVAPTSGWAPSPEPVVRASAILAFLLLAGIASAQTIQDPSLKGGVTVRRDGRGIPYIKAANEHDLFFAQGYVTASDRLFQMEMLRRAVRGELAEGLGKDVLDEDKRRRVYRFGRLADASVPLQAPDFGAALTAYADGVNAWVDGHRDALPVEFAKLKIERRPWEPPDTLPTGFLFSRALSTTCPND